MNFSGGRTTGRGACQTNDDHDGHAMLLVVMIEPLMGGGAFDLAN